MGAAREKRPFCLSHSQETVATFLSAPFGLLSRWVLQCPGLGLGWVFPTLWPLKPHPPAVVVKGTVNGGFLTLLYLAVFGGRMLS